MADPFRDRTRRLQQRLLGEGEAGAVLFPSPNLYYLTGFWEEPMERHLLCFIPATGDPVFVAPELYEDQLGAETWIESVQTYPDGKDPKKIIADTGSSLDMATGTIRLDPTMWARFALDLEQVFPDARFDLLDDQMAQLRMTKDEEELQRLEAAGDAADEVMTAIRELGTDAVGMTESELARWIRDALLERGASVSFEPVVGSGPNGAKPHHRHGDRQIQTGDPVVLDFGVRNDRYPSDTTRTVVFEGEPPADFEHVHEIVTRAQKAAIAAVEPGVTAEAVDEAARSIIEDAGYGEEFCHRTGHGIGLDVHEDPYIVDRNDLALEPGMVFSVEPGVYLEGRFGVRIEDIVVVTETGCRGLNDSPKAWRC